MISVSANLREEALMAERFLVIGCMGCLGAWTVRLLIDEGADVVGSDLSTDNSRLRLLLSEEELSRVRLLQGDIVETGAVRDLVAKERVTHIVHLAALQVPTCKADPVAGSRVNVTGTVNVFEAALANGVDGLAYASSVAVFGPPDLYREDPVRDDARPAPRTLYGAYKLANEETARIYAQDHGLTSVGLRPYIVYGPGRDQGLTSGATVAMLAAAAGSPFHISHGGTAMFQYAPDVARAFIDAARSSPQRAEVLNVGGPAVSMGEVVAAIEAAAPEAAGSITFEDTGLPFPPRLDGSELDRLIGQVPYTPITEGVAESVELFRRLLTEGKVRLPQA
jgi:UDP-glucuronate 4-epimerase